MGMLRGMVGSVPALRRAREQASRFGDELAVARAASGWSRQDVSRRANVSWSTVTRAEAGSPNVSLAILCRVAEAVGLDLVLRAHPGRAPGLRDTGQLVLAERVVRQAAVSWQPTIELLVGDHGEAIDVVLFGPKEILAIEIERMVVDYQAQHRRADAKRRSLSARHQRPVRLVMLFEDTRRNRRVVEPHLGVIGAALPAGPRAVLHSLRTGAELGTDGRLWMRRYRPSR